MTEEIQKLIVEKSEAADKRASGMHALCWGWLYHHIGQIKRERNNPDNIIKLVETMETMLTPIAIGFHHIPRLLFEEYLASVLALREVTLHQCHQSTILMTDRIRQSMHQALLLYVGEDKYSDFDKDLQDRVDEYFKEQGLL